MERKKPKLLNSFFKIVSYNGGSDGPKYGIENILIPKYEPFHCSGKGTNFDLVLKYEGISNSFSMTHFIIQGGVDCIAPIKEGLVWISDLEPNIEYSTKYNNITKEQFNSLPKSDNFKPILFFTTSKDTFEFETKLQPWIKGSFIHLKVWFFE